MAPPLEGGAWACSGCGEGLHHKERWSRIWCIAALLAQPFSAWIRDLGVPPWAALATVGAFVFLSYVATRIELLRDRPDSPLRLYDSVKPLGL